MEGEQNIFEGMTEEERVDAAPLLMELGAVIDVSEGVGDVLGVLDAESVEMAQKLAGTPEGRSTINFLKIILGIDKPSKGPKL